MPPFPAPLIELAGAVAVLVEPAPADAPGRDGAAALALRRFTGDPHLVVSRRPSGRPRLSPPYCEVGVAMSTCRNALLVGFDPRRAVGVDLEAEASVGVDEVERLASDHFSAAEADAISRAASDDRRELFLRLWVAKEAALKVTGRGVYDGLRWPELASAGASQAGTRWRARVAASGHAGALEICVRRIELSSAGPAWAALCVETGAASVAAPN